MYNTHPIIVHDPDGSLCPFLSSIIGRLSPREDSEDVTILTWNDRREKGMLEKSLDCLKVKYRVLGKKKRTRWRNIQKIGLTCVALERVRTKYVIGIDSFDAICLDGPKEILRRFKNDFECDLLFNAAISSYKTPDYCREFEAHYFYL